MRINSESEQEFFKSFNDLKLKVTSGNQTLAVNAVYAETRMAFDFLIKAGPSVLAVVEIKNLSNLRAYDPSKLESYVSEHNIRYFAYGEVNSLTVVDRRKNITLKDATVPAFGALLVQDDAHPISPTLKNDIGNRIKDVIVESEFGFLKTSIGDIGQRLIDELEYDDVNQTWAFQDSANIDSVENLIFRNLLRESKVIREIYRYTTLDTCFQMLKNGSLRMNCLVGMNDTSEVNYAENYIFGGNRAFSSAPIEIIDAYNNRFISSCTLRRDDLNQWRLYADDSRGVCLVFKVKTRLEQPSSFIIKRISYANKNGVHPELDLVRSIISCLKTDLAVTFEFRTLSVWRHFFKPFDFRDEEEVRILLIPDPEKYKKDWLLTASHGILNPFVTLDLNDPDLPIELSEIILGPKCPEGEINRVQLEHFLRVLSAVRAAKIKNNGVKSTRKAKSKTPKVSNSGIRTYR